MAYSISSVSASSVMEFFCRGMSQPRVRLRHPRRSPVRSRATSQRVIANCSSYAATYAPSSGAVSRRTSRMLTRATQTTLTEVNEHSSRAKGRGLFLHHQFVYDSFCIHFSYGLLGFFYCSSFCLCSILSFGIAAQVIEV